MTNPLIGLGPDVCGASLHRSEAEEIASMHANIRKLPFIAVTSLLALIRDVNLTPNHIWPEPSNAA
jgi:hypothetical protein